MSLAARSLSPTRCSTLQARFSLKVPQTQLMLMGVIGGKERTLKQWEDLAAGAGFEVEQLTDSPSPACQLLTLTPK